MENIKTILSENIVGTLATVNGDGSPWATPLHIFSDENALYWFSKEDTQHSKNIEQNSNVSLALWSKNGAPKAAYLNGLAEGLDDAGAERATNIVVETLGSVPDVFKNTSAYRLEIGQLDTSKSSENRWYFYT